MLIMLWCQKVANFLYSRNWELMGVVEEVECSSNCLRTTMLPLAIICRLVYLVGIDIQISYIIFYSYDSTLSTE